MNLFSIFSKEKKKEVLDTGLKKTKESVFQKLCRVVAGKKEVDDDVLDDLRVFEDIAYPDSYGHEFYALNDGSYIISENGIEALYGEAYRIRDGQISMICKNDESRIL